MGTLAENESIVDKIEAFDHMEENGTLSEAEKESRNDYKASLTQLPSKGVEHMDPKKQNSMAQRR